MSLDEVKQKLKVLLKREPSCSRLADGRYIADYLQYKAPAAKFVGVSEEEALGGLLTFLEAKPPATEVEAEA